MANTFGLYVGNSTASIAIFKEERKVEVLANEAGDRVTPTVVTLSHEEKVVGPTSVSFSKAFCTVTNNKKLLDTTLKLEDLEQCIEQSSVPISKENGITYTISETDQKPLLYTPVQVAVLIFKKLYNIGVGACGEKSLSCVICAPHSWNDDTKVILQEAAEEAGWKVLQIINEAPAALLAYHIGFEKVPQEMNVLVYRLGGISCEASVIKVESGFYSILSSFESQTGGQAMVTALRDHLVEEFARKYYLDPTESRKSMWKFRVAAQSMLHTLSTVPMCSRFIESACEGVDFNVSVSVARLNSLLSPLLPVFSQPIHKALEAANLQASDISKIILCGGCLKIPKIRSHVSSFFDCEALCSIPPDEVLACGAAEQAGLVCNLGISLKSSEKIPFLSSPITMKLNNEEIILEKNVIPSFKQLNIQADEEVVNISANQGSLEGKTKLDIDVPSELKVNLKVTSQGEILIEALNKTSKESIKGFIDFHVD
ncbi:heat shock 70 kDa protein 14 [Halyomorpha halys]|uniref:heat shock 70 kDa protein 14 n=1 Tax=Halyomorpha halys TaxID=286706 RepID=UPI0006D4ED33|nr:heat shock 70 kDa protein 14-like [Halyomorpha halys]